MLNANTRHNRQTQLQCSAHPEPQPIYGLRNLLTRGIVPLPFHPLLSSGKLYDEHDYLREGITENQIASEVLSL